ncbi:hypothetical protein MMC22_004944 [Lobaria immixta]|nr:hypothetical protein [Lobaria immixta]
MVSEEGTGLQEEQERVISRLKGETAAFSQPSGKVTPPPSDSYWKYLGWLLSRQVLISFEKECGQKTWMAMKHLVRAQSGEAATDVETDNYAFSTIVKAWKGGDGG